MIKLKLLYSNQEEKESLLTEIGKTFIILKVSKEYQSQGQYKRIHVELEKGPKH